MSGHACRRSEWRALASASLQRRHRGCRTDENTLSREQIGQTTARIRGRLNFVHFAQEQHSIYFIEQARGRRRAPFNLPPAPLRAMSHTACRHGLGSARHGDGAARRCRYGSGDRWGTPGKVPVWSCRWPGPGRARPSSARRVCVPLTCSWQLLAAARGLGWRRVGLLLRRQPAVVSERPASRRRASARARPS